MKRYYLVYQVPTNAGFVTGDAFSSVESITEEQIDEWKAQCCGLVSNAIGNAILLNIIECEDTV